MPFFLKQSDRSVSNRPFQVAAPREERDRPASFSPLPPWTLSPDIPAADAATQPASKTLRTGDEQHRRRSGRSVSANSFARQIQQSLQSIWHQTGFGDRSVWNWLELLLLPILLMVSVRTLSTQAQLQQAQQTQQANQQAQLRQYTDQLFQLQLAYQQQTVNKQTVRELSTALSQRSLRTPDPATQGQVLQILYDLGYLRRSPLLRAADLSFDQASLPAASLVELYAPEISLQQADLINADLSGSNLQRSNLQAANLDQASLAAANLRRANLTFADMDEVNLSDANLQKAQLNSAVLRNVDFRGADLSQADLSNADVQRSGRSAALLTGEELYELVFESAILCDTRLPDGSVSQRDCP